MELLIPSFLLFALLVWREFAHDRDRKAWNVERSALDAFATNQRERDQAEFAAERRELLTAAETERQTLLNRIQAPQVEVAKQWEPEVPEMSLPHDDDEAFNKYRDEVEA